MKCAIHPDREAVTSCQHTHEEIVVSTTEKGKKIYEKRPVKDCDYGMCEQCAAVNPKICPTCEKADLEGTLTLVNGRFKFALIGLILTVVITLAVLFVWLFARDNFIVVAATFAVVTAISFVVTQEVISRQFKKTFSIYWIAFFSLVALGLTPILLIYFITIFIITLLNRQKAKLALSAFMVKFNGLTAPEKPAEPAPVPEAPAVEAPVEPSQPETKPVEDAPKNEESK